MNRLLTACLLLPLAACRSAAPLVAPTPGAPPAHDNLNAVVWTQTAAEFAATTRTLYTLAAARIADALADTAWTADPFQQQKGGYGTLPPAIVMDVDETVLDNSPYQARLVLAGAPYADSTWRAWVEERRARAIPGAAAFVRQARAEGVQVVFVTNRDAASEKATVDNLERVGIGATAPGEDLVLTRGETPAWATGDKEPRRAAVRARYRVILYVGDNLGDFLSGERASVAERARLAAPFETYWGRRWIMLPNPQYGSWEGAALDNDWAAPPAAQRAAKRRHLDPQQ